MIACNSAAAAGLEPARGRGRPPPGPGDRGDRAGGARSRPRSPPPGGWESSRPPRPWSRAPTDGRAAAAAAATSRSPRSPPLSSPRSSSTGFPFDAGGRRHGSRLLRAAARGRRGHRDPRLHALPAGRGRCSSGSWAATCAWSRPGTRWPRPRSACSSRARSRPSGAARGATASCARATSTSFRELGTRFLQMPLGEVELVDPSRGYPWDMTILEQVQADTREAMKAGERDRVGALRLLVDALQKDLKDGGDDEVAVLRRERKRRLEAAAAYRDGGNDDRASGRGRRGDPDRGLPARRALRRRAGRDRRRGDRSESGRLRPPGHGGSDGQRPCPRSPGGPTASA